MRPGVDVQARDVDRLQRVGGIQIRGDGGDLAAGDRHVAHGADLVARIDDVAAAQQQIVLRLRPGWRRLLRDAQRPAEAGSDDRDAADAVQPTAA